MLLQTPLLIGLFCIKPFNNAAAAPSQPLRHIRQLYERLLTLSYGYIDQHISRLAILFMVKTWENIYKKNMEDNQEGVPAKSCGSC